MAKNKFDLTFAVVSGQGPFPMDMLRYDRAFPYSETDSGTIQRCEYGGERRVVVVARYAGTPGDWTTDRWRSFGWAFKAFDEVSAANDEATYLKKSFEAVNQKEGS